MRDSVSVAGRSSALPEQIEQLVKLRARVLLCGGLPGVVEIVGRKLGRGFYGAGNVVHAAKRGLRDLERGVDGGDRVLVAGDGGDLRAQAHRETAVETDAGIAVGLLARAELSLQVVQLGAHRDERLHHERGRGPNVVDAHVRLTSSSASR
jgi:hypothetical protein